MKKILIPMMILFLTVLLLIACSDDDNQSGNNDKTVRNQTENEDQQESSSTDKKRGKSEAASESEESATDDSNKNERSNSTSKSNEDSELSKYSSDEIEYARVWLQLGPNQEIDELNVRHIPTGEPVNPYDDTSANYLKDVIQLEGSRSVDGSVTYSGNGDGTINVYDVPSHWASPARVDENFMKEYTEDIINNSKLVPIDPGEEKEIIKLIEMLNIRS